MTASRYQSGELPSRAGLGIAFTDEFLPSQEVFEVVFGADALADPEHVGRHHVRVELDEVVLAMPLEPLFGDEVMDLVGLSRIDLEVPQGQMDPSGLGVVRIEVHHDEDEVRTIPALLAVRDKGLVVDIVES